MRVYLDLVILLNGLVDFLLLLGTNRLLGYPANMKRLIPAAVLGGLYAGATFLPGFAFLGNYFWRSVFFVLLSLLAFGLGPGGVSGGALFFLLSMALGGIAAAMGKRSFPALVLAGGGVLLLCRFGFRRVPGTSRILPAKLWYGEKEMDVLAFHDTGNTLRDPITGEQVMVAGADVAGKLLCLTAWQLSHPVDALKDLPGMRLIPYRSVGNAGGMLLATRIPKMQIGSYCGSVLMAFAPEAISGEYQILTGGAL